MVVLTEQGLNRYPSRQLRTSGKLVPQLPADTPWAAETPKDTNQLWLAHGAKAMELLMTERRYQEWLERHSDLSQAAKDARYIWDFELWLRPNGETAPLGSIPAGLMGAMAVYGYDREVALHGWREIGIDIEDIEDQQRKDLERLWEDVGLSRPQN